MYHFRYLSIVVVTCLSLGLGAFISTILPCLSKMMYRGINSSFSFSSILLFFGFVMKKLSGTSDKPSCSTAIFQPAIAEGHSWKACQPEQIAGKEQGKGHLCGLLGKLVCALPGRDASLGKAERTVQGKRKI